MLPYRSACGSVLPYVGRVYVAKCSGNEKVGVATATIKGCGNYKGTVKKKFTIVPTTPSLYTPGGERKAIWVEWGYLPSQVTGYQLLITRDKTFSSKNKRLVTVRDNEITSKKISKLKAKKTYYVKVRSYKTVGGKTYYSPWSDARSVKTY